ncbi:paired box protein Pax-6-like [Ostrea edulis]|uniref:paired box protein Pax-6-like n=1 Tax=Ostrea edulis TaxID=37623 RepID=UPI0024AE88C6|nr:paired box protein Pax-6-like [Ostrea edulis]
MGASKKVSTRSRIKYRADQIETMEKSFREQQYPDSESIEQLAEKVGVSTERVAIWFQNRRAKFKRESKDMQTNWMRKQFHTSISDTTSCVTSDKSSHVITPSLTEADVESRLQTERHPPRNFHYLPSCMATFPNGAHNSSFSPGVSTSSNALMTPPPPYSNSLPQRHSIPEYTPSHSTFRPQYVTDYQQPYFRHHAPPQPLLPVSHLHVAYTPGYQLMQL